MMRPKVLLTSPLHPKIQIQLASECDIIVAPDTQASTFKSLIRDVDGLIVRNQLPPDIFEDAPRLRVVVRHGVGLDMIPVEAATAKKIPVANFPGCNAQAVAEYCLAAMFSLRRNVVGMDTVIRSKGWSQARAAADHHLELGATTLGIVGVGAIGALLARMARGLGMSVLGLTRRPETLPEGVRAVDKKTLFSESDVVVLACPLTEQTKNLVDEAALAHMKSRAILINVSRGPVVNTNALVSALREGRLGGAVLDVFDAQPLKGDEPVFDCPNLLITPHCAGSTESSSFLTSQAAVQTLLALLGNQQPGNVVNPEVFKS
jgi:D-3-phosphoglycerate dehydrogenase / 2-oxoglutarate reductase